MKKRTKALQIDRKTADRVIERDGECVLCRLGFIEEINPCDIGAYIHDIAHFIPRSQGGLGIEKNLVLLCRQHHHELDNGNKGKRAEYLEALENYFKNIYPNWNREELKYKKYDY